MGGGNGDFARLKEVYDPKKYGQTDFFYVDAHSTWYAQRGNVGGGNKNFIFTFFECGFEAESSCKQRFTANAYDYWGNAKVAEFQVDRARNKVYYGFPSNGNWVVNLDGTNAIRNSGPTHQHNRMVLGQGRWEGPLKDEGRWETQRK